MSPQLLSIYKITELRYADDTALFSTTSEGFNNLVQAVNKHGAAYKLSINAAKTKIMELDKWQENTTIVIDNVNVERVQSFQYLGAMFTTKGDGASNIKQRLAMAVQALNNMQYMWKSDSKELKLKVLRTCIFQIATYGCERWVLRKLDIKRINAIEMKCYHNILHIPWIAHRTNCSILNIYNRLPVLQISMFRSSSQDLVAASGQRRPAKPSGALCIMQSTTTCWNDCVMCPQARVADSWAPQSFNVSPTRAVPQRRRFSFTHCLQGRSATGGSTGLGWGQAVRMRGGPLSKRSLHALA